MSWFAAASISLRRPDSNRASPIGAMQLVAGALILVCEMDLKMASASPRRRTILADMGLEVYEGFDEAHLDPVPDLVVVPGMLMATTNVLCTDIAVVPFLWVLPLGVYLLSFDPSGFPQDKPLPVLVRVLVLVRVRSLLAQEPDPL